MWPLRRAIMAGRAAWAQRCAPWKLTAMTWSQSSMEVLARMASRVMPAAQINRSTWRFSKKVRMAEGSVTSRSVREGASTPEFLLEKRVEMAWARLPFPPVMTICCTADLR